MMTGHNHEEKLQELIDATMDLTEEVAVGKKELDNAVSSTKADAASALSSSQVATTKANEAKQSATLATSKANEAKTSADNAASVVTGGTATLEPTAGKIPLADSKGVIDSGWIPLINAMYPHSGVIGGVDKGELFFFVGISPATSHANKIWLLGGTSYNIAGRLVHKPGPNNHPVTLPEAESTPERAIAFDDVFLDWDGNVTPYRSITPHRTTTGYDADAIATEHGYSKIQTGLYKTGDTYALLLGRVARRNKGAYHPVFNKEGCSRWRAVNNGVTTTGGVYWYDGASVFNASVERCFTFRHDGSSDVPAAVGGVSGSIGNISGRKHDDKRYDAIYADDFTPLYYSARAVIDRKALLDDSFNRAVAGETFMGAEGTYTVLEEGRQPIYLYAGINNMAVYTSHSPTSWINKAYGGSSRIKDLAQDEKKIYFSLQGHYFSGTVNTGQISSNLQIHNITPSIYAALPDLPTNTSHVVDKFSILSWEDVKPLTDVSACPQFLMVDIIGSLDAMPDEWKIHGIPGNWLAVGEEGESLIPDGTTKNFKLSRKCLEVYQVLYTPDNGSTWTDHTNTWKLLLEGASNGATTSIPSDRCYLFFYRTSANPFELTNTPTNLCFGDVFATHNYDKRFGVELVSNLINKVCVGATGDYAQTVPMLNGSYYKVASIGLAPNRYASNLEHAPFALHAYANSPSAKVWPALSAYNNTLHLAVSFKELKWKDDVLGDNSSFRDVLKVSNYGTVTDLNGESCIAGHKMLELPFHFDGEY